MIDGEEFVRQQPALARALAAMAEAHVLQRSAAPTTPPEAPPAPRPKRTRKPISAGG